MLKEIAKEKLSEVVKAIVPIVAIVLILSVTIVPMPTHVVMVFFYGCILLMIGMVFFTIGSEQAMEPMGKQVGARITKTRKLYLILPLGLLLGFMITISEPDLQVLANQVQSIPNSVLIMSVSGGVAFFLVMALLRMVVGIPLQRMLLFFYVIAFVLGCDHRTDDGAFYHGFWCGRVCVARYQTLLSGQLRADCALFNRTYYFCLAVGSYFPSGKCDI